MKKLDITKVTYEEFTDIDFISPANLFIKDALGDYLFFHTRSRQLAQEECDTLYGKNHYKVNTSKVSKNNKGLTVSGTETRKK